MNTSFFENWTSNYFQVYLNASANNVTWFNASEGLEQVWNWTHDENGSSAKISWVINTSTAPQPLYYKLIVGIDARAKNFINGTIANNSVQFSVPVQNDTYSLFLNWSDIIPLIQSDKVFVKRGLKTIENNSYFYWILQSVNKVPVNFTFEIDPIFGESGTPGGSLQVIDDQLCVSRFTCPSSGVSSSITAYLKITADTVNISAYIYDDNSNLVGESEKRLITGDDAWHWQTFNITDNLIEGNDYYLGVWSEDGSGLSRFAGITPTTSPVGAWYDAETYDYGNPPDPASFSLANPDLNHAIYCTYSENTTVGRYVLGYDTIGTSNHENMVDQIEGTYAIAQYSGWIDAIYIDLGYNDDDHNVTLAVYNGVTGERLGVTEEKVIATNDINRFIRFNLSPSVEVTEGQKYLITGFAQDEGGGGLCKIDYDVTSGTIYNNDDEDYDLGYPAQLDWGGTNQSGYQFSIYASYHNYTNCTTYPYYKEITINHSYVDGDLTNFPILISNISSDFISFSDEQFGQPAYTTYGQTDWNSVSGSNFTCEYDGIAESITVIWYDNGNSGNATCGLYYHDSDTLVAQTEVKLIGGTSAGYTVEIFNFSGTVDLNASQRYYIVLHGESGLGYTVAFYTSTGDHWYHYYDPYDGTLPSSATWTEHDDMLLAIYCNYHSNTSKVRPDGYDFVLTNQTNATVYNHEIEKFDNKIGELIAWVNITELSSGTDTTLFLHYGNKTTGTNENVNDTWDSNYVGIYHADSTFPFADSSGNNFDGTNNGVTSATGQIGDGWDLWRNQSDYIDLGNNDPLKLNDDNQTIEMWIKTRNWPDAVEGKTPYDCYENSQNYFYYSPYRVSSLAVYAEHTNIYHDSSLSFSPTLDFDATAYQFFVMGIDKSDVANTKGFARVNQTTSDYPASDFMNFTGDTFTPNGNVNIGRRGSGTNYLNASIDEFRISNILRTDEWHNTTFNTTAFPELFLTVGSEQTCEEAPVGEQWYLISSDKNGSWVNLTTYHLISNDKNGSWVNTTVGLNWYLISGDKNGSWINGTTFHLISSDKNGSWVNITTDHLISSDKNGSWVNTTVGIIWHLISSDKNGSWINTTTFQLISSDKNGSWVNDTYTWQLISNDKNGSWVNTSLPAVITITNVFPSNNSYNIPLQPYVYATFQHQTGNIMNISWYNDTILLGTENNVSNGTYYELFLQASSKRNNYVLNISVNDGLGNWVNETHSFNTEGDPVEMWGINNTYSLVFAVIGLLGVFGLLGYLKRKKKRS